MGYDTKFAGELKFTCGLNDEQMEHLNGILGESSFDHPEWDDTDVDYVELEMTDDNDGLQWNGTEKVSDMEEQINVVIREMQKKYPEFGLAGKIMAQGEDLEDRYAITIVGGLAIRQYKIIELILTDSLYDLLKLEAHQDRITIEEYAEWAIADYIERNKV